MNEKNLFTTDKKAIAERNVYIAMIAEELREHRYKNYLGDHYIAIPTNLAIEYLTYKGSYNDKLTTCLKKYDGRKSKYFSEKIRKQISNLYDEKARKDIDELLEYVIKHTEIAEKKNKNFLIDEDSNPKAHEHLKKRLIGPEPIELLDFPKTTVKGIERKLKKLTESHLMIKAFDHARTRATLEETYKARTLVNTIDEIWEDLVINNTTEEPIAGYEDKSLTEIVNEAVQNYEVKDKPHYLINKSYYKSAVRGNFEPKLEEISKKED